MTSLPIHSFSAELFHYRDVFVFRWYGFAYLAAFAIAFLGLRRAAAQGRLALASRDVLGFVLFGALFGVLLGGRLGAVLFYGWEIVRRDWTEALKADINDASFAGGLAGVAIYVVWYARAHKIPFRNLADHLALVAPAGLFLGRLAQFFSMPPDAFGRVTTSRFAMLFPTEVHLASFRADHDPMGIGDALPRTAVEIMEIARANPPILDQLLAMLQPRHPWALYETLLSGIVLGLMLVVVRRGFPKLPDGVLAGIFLLLCGVFTFGLGFLREPLPGHGQTIGLTLEQWMCLPMLPAGLGLLLWPQRCSRDRGAGFVGQPQELD